LLVDLSDGELTGDKRGAVIAHVAACDACRSELARLDASLNQLKSCLTQSVAIAPTVSSARPRSGWHLQATGLAALLVAAVSVWLASRPNIPPSVAGLPQAIPDSPAVATAPVISQAHALRRIALLEQQARLQTSLDLMPQAAWYDQQRADNEKLLDGFKAAVGFEPESVNTTSSGGEKL